MRPLDGIRVLDFTWVVAGPVTTRILADLGADVIKVERRGSLDFGDRRGGLSGTLMRGKRSLLLDLNDPRGLDLARRLAAVSDVVIDNFSARVMTNLGLTVPYPGAPFRLTDAPWRVARPPRLGEHNDEVLG